MILPLEALQSYRKAAASNRAAVDELMIEVAAKCAADTRAGHPRPMGLRCQKCPEFVHGACTLRDKVKNGHD